MNSASVSKKTDDRSPFVVAVVEDDRLLRQEIEIHLRANQFTVHGLSSGAALDDLVSPEPIDLFIIWGMGYQLCVPINLVY